MSCAAGLAALDIYQEEQLFDRAKVLIPYFKNALMGLKGHPKIRDIRQIGLMAGIELHPYPAPGKRGGAAQVAMYKKGLHIKFTGDNGIMAPMFICEQHHIDEIMDKFVQGLDATD